ncbi:MAG: GNAT family N-acetyltransferase [Pseudomonadota bacterium]
MTPQTRPPTHPLTRTLTPAEIVTAVDWAIEEGWNAGLHDAATFTAADPGAFFGSFAGDALAAVVSVARHTPEQGFLGFYICHPDRRGQGFGWAVWQAGLARLPGATIGLDGVPAQQTNYARSGFVLHHRNIRHVATLPASALAPPPTGTTLVDTLGPHSPLGPALAAYDAAITGHTRPAYLAAWLAQPDAALRIAHRDGRITGYALRRPCNGPAKIGPLMADDPATAEALFTALAAGQGPVTLDLPEPNAPARALAETHDLIPVFETARMYRGPAPQLDLARLWGVMSFEFG